MKFVRLWKQTRLTGNWNKLFEVYRFFEAYKNFLQIDVRAANADDLRKWKGWVESRLRQLTLKIERHTMNMLQCHPHPGDFSDKSRPFHSCYFMGLQSKQGVASNEAEPFDMRLTVEEFKHAVGMYTLWKPGMEIYVSHVKRKNIWNFAYPGEVRPARPIRISKPKVSGQVEVNCLPQEFDSGRKRKLENCDLETNLRNAKCLAGVGMPGELDCESQISNGSASCSTKVGSNDAEMSGNFCIEKAKDHAAVELEDVPDYKNQARVSGGLTTGSSMESTTKGSLGLSLTTGRRVGSFSSLPSTGKVEELEPPELLTPAAPSLSSSSAQKPVLRFNFTSLAKATVKSGA